MAMRSQEFAISTAQLDEIPYLTNIERLASLATYPNESIGLTAADVEQWPWDRRIAKYARMRDNPGKSEDDISPSRLLAAHHVGKVVGFAAVIKGNHLHKLYVDPHHQRYGVGGALIAVAEAQVCDWGGTEMELEVVDYNKSAIEFYEHMGYVLKHNPGPHFIEQLGVEMNELVYSKLLTPKTAPNAKQ